MTKIIALTQGQVAQVSDEWYEELSKFKWYAVYNPHTRSFYAARMSSTLLGKRKIILMHRVIAGTPNGMQCDHIDHNTLNEQPENLRNCTCSQNMNNSGKHIDNTSGFKGVFANHKNWQVQIWVDSKRLYLGTYPTREEAAHAYDEAAKEHHGEFAVLNFE
jgi:hypothetical protein